MRIASIIQLLLFVAFLFTPAVAWLAGVEGGGSALENKALAPVPRPTLSTVADASFGKAFSDWVWDSVPLRDVLLHLDHAVDLRVFGDSPVPTVLFGEQGFAFARERVVGHKAGGTVKPTALVAAIDRIERAFAAAGMRLVIIVSPNKASIHEEMLPPEYRAAHQRQTGAMLAALRERASRGTLVDLHGPLLAEKARLASDPTIVDERLRSVFRRLDQHWNLEAGRIQARAIVNAIDPSAWSDALAPAIVGPYLEVESELSEIYLKTGETEPYARLEPRVALKHQIAAQVHRYSNEAPTAKPLKIAVVRDSFLSSADGAPRSARDGGFETIASFFAATAFVHWDQVFSTAGDKALRGADVCVIQVYEGNLAVLVRNPARFEALLQTLK